MPHGACERPSNVLNHGRDTVHELWRALSAEHEEQNAERRTQSGTHWRRKKQIRRQEQYQFRRQSETSRFRRRRPPRTSTRVHACTQAHGHTRASICIHARMHTHTHTVASYYSFKGPRYHILLFVVLLCLQGVEIRWRSGFALFCQRAAVSYVALCRVALARGIKIRWCWRHAMSVLICCAPWCMRKTFKCPESWQGHRA